MPYSFSVAPDKWEIDENGFMRCRARFLSVGLMTYACHELGENEVPPGKNPDDLLNIFISPDTLSDPKAIRSLEGMPVVALEHQWTGPEESYHQVGSVAGTPRVDGPYLEGDIVITDPKTIEAIKAGLLSDISSAYLALFTMDPGEYDGNSYDGRQTELRYNHLALLRPGEGRAGLDVRILNSQSKKEDKPMPTEFTVMQLTTGHKVKVANESVDALTNAIEKVKTENQEMSSGQMEQALAEIEKYKAEKAEMEKMISEKSAELMAMKERLDAALDPGMMEESMNQMMEEKEEAADMMYENAGMEKKEAMNSLKGLAGHSLRKTVVEKIRTANSQDALTDDQLKNEGFVTGMYNAYKSMAPRKREVAGPGVIKNMNKGPGKERTNAQRLGY